VDSISIGVVWPRKDRIWHVKDAAWVPLWPSMNLGKLKISPNDEFIWPGLPRDELYQYGHSAHDY
jgi:hypothetical protein